MKWWDKISSIGLDGNYEDHQKVQLVFTVNRILFLVCFFSGLYLPALIFFKSYFHFIVQAICTLLFCCGYFFSAKKIFRLGSYYIYLVVIANLSFDLIAYNYIGFEYIMIPASVSPFGVFKKKSDAILVFTASIICCIAAQIIRLYVSPLVVLEENFTTAFYYLNLFMAFALSTTLIINFKIEIERYTKTILYQKRQIEERNKETTASINYAKRIQYTLLSSDDLKNSLSEYFVLFIPKDIVSGDFYWTTKMQGDSSSKQGTASSRFYLAVCDSTGHGVPGSFMSLLNMSFLNEAITAKNIEQPHEVFNYVRKRLIESISQDGGQDGMDGTLIKLEMKNEKLTLEYASAHNTPILIRNNQLTHLPADKMPVGKGEIINDFKLHAIDIKKNDCLYFFTDGYADQFGGSKGKKFKYRQLEEKLLSISNKPMEEQKDILEKNFHDWRGDLEQVDDVLIIGARI